MDLGDNRVNVVFEINEGGRTKIAADQFRRQQRLQRPPPVATSSRPSARTILSFLLRNDIYDEDRLRADEEALRRFYYNRGYADFQVVSAIGELDAVDQRVHDQLHRRGRRALHVRRRHHREHDPRRRPPRASAALIETQRGRRLQRQGRRGLDHRADREGRRHRAMPSRRSRRAATAISRTTRSRSSTRSTRARAPMSSASKSAATTARATTSSAASSTSAKATPSTRC